MPAEVSNIAMVFTLVSFTMLFATLFLTFAIFRLTAEAWPPFGVEKLSLFYPGLSTVVIALSSLTYWRFEKSGGPRWFGMTLALGLAFLGLQLKFWAFLKTLGIFASTGTFGSLIYGFTWIHAAHVLAALALLLWVLPTARSRESFEGHSIRIRNVGMFWHFLGIVWFLIFLIIFVL